jgi:hypothetical protein
LRVHSFEVLNKILGSAVFISGKEVVAMYRRAGSE